MSEHNNSGIAPLWVVAAVMAAFISGLLAGAAHGDNAPAAFAHDAPLSAEEMSIFWSVWETLGHRFVPSTASTSTSPTDQEKLWGAIQGLTGAYGDPYTVFLPPQENKIFEEDISGNFEGVGMEIGIRDNVLTIIAPLDNSPAQRAGLLPGDRIIRIDETSAQGMSVERAVQLIRGERGTDVVFTIIRAERPEPFEVTVTRDTIQIPTIETKMEDGVFIIRIHNFSAIAPDLFRGALREFVQKSATGQLIIDVRNNPGGFLAAAVDMASWFLSTGDVIVTEHYGSKRSDFKHRSRGYNIFTNELPVVVLVNGGSASASEIFAAALQQHNRAVVIGTQTFGKGSVQELIPITDTTSLKVTVARWLTPDGSSLSDGGLTPDIIVEGANATSTQADPQLTRAIEYLVDGE